jgi:hypothetical protein
MGKNTIVFVCMKYKLENISDSLFFLFFETYFRIVHLSKVCELNELKYSHKMGHSLLLICDGNN